MREVASTAVEDYVRAVYLLQEASPEAAVSTNQLAARLQVRPASASAMVKRLAELGYVRHTGYRGAVLTDKGRRLGLELTRHHRLLEQFLAEVLGVPWDRLHEEADRLEHGLSEEVEARMADRLGHPLRDPHGDPIPSDGLALSEPASVPLVDLPVGAKGRFVRIRDPQPEMLRYLAGEGVAVGERLEVLARDPLGETLVRARRRSHAIPAELGALMRIEVED